MIERTQAHAELKNSNPNSTPESDWDVIAEIWSIIQAGSLADTQSFVHVKGHADKDKLYDQLTLRQQLNVDADKLAGGYITCWTNSKEINLGLHRPGSPTRSVY